MGKTHESAYWKVYKVVGGEMTIFGRIGPDGFKNFSRITDSPVYIGGNLMN